MNPGAQNISIKKKFDSYEGKHASKALFNVKAFAPQFNFKKYKSPW